MPYHLSEAHSNRSPQERLSAGFADFRQAWGQPPDIIVVNSNLWDARRMVYEEDIANITNTLDIWMYSFSRTLSQIDIEFPETRVKLVHTAAQTLRYAQWGQMHPSAINDLNVAATSIAYDLNWQVGDITHLTAGFPNMTLALRDTLHPRPFVMLTMFNVYCTLWLLDIHSTA